MSKADRRLTGARRTQVAQAALMQGMLVVVLLGLAWFYRSQPRTALLCATMAIIPGAWGLAIWDAQKRDAQARLAGTWPKESDTKLKNRTFTILGIAVAVALALVVLIYRLS